MDAEQLKRAIRDVPDFPKAGILFKDITPVLSDPSLFGAAVDTLAARYAEKNVDKVAVIDARGFIFGSAVAYKLGAGLIPIRKKGKLPYKTYEQTYALEYGTATLSIHVDACEDGKRIALIDDLLATGGTAAASAKLIEQAGGEVVGIDFLIELAFLKGREKLTGYDVCSVVVFD
ncbi:MAG: adenine phosphoribosyltransferase [Kiritimatiellae bacterium]|nr:adenine phosphoribosyltransferase [Kiritimatiellia bacterium]